MSEILKDGGPAFPLASEELSDRLDAGIKLHTGLSIRDYFAAKAMQTLIADKVYRVDIHYPGTETISTISYHMADAMLKARKEVKA